MAIDCTPGALMTNSACFCGYTNREIELVTIYLLREIAELSDMTPAQLVAAAKCMCGIPPEVRNNVIAYLVCAAADAAGA